MGINVESNDRALFFSTHVILPSLVTVIHHASFRHHFMLKVIELRNGLEVIEQYAFEDCEKLTTVVLPGGFYLLKLEHLRVVHYWSVL